MKCKQAKSELALRIGGDLPEAPSLELERHVAVCPSCRTVREGLKSSHSALQEVAAAPPRPAGPARASSPSDSLWPAVSARLSRRETPRTRQFNGWLPALAVTAASIAVIFVAGQNAAQYARSSASQHPDSWQAPVQVMPAFYPDDERPGMFSRERIPFDRSTLPEVDGRNGPRKSLSLELRPFEGIGPETTRRP